MRRLLVLAALLALCLVLGSAATANAQSPIEVEDIGTGLPCDDPPAGGCIEHGVDTDLQLYVHTIFGEVLVATCVSEADFHFRSDGTGWVDDVSFAGPSCNGLTACEEPWDFEVVEQGGTLPAVLDLCITNGVAGECEGSLAGYLIIPSGLREEEPVQISGTNCELGVFWEFEELTIEAHHL
jgi:hypothetical protein